MNYWLVKSEPGEYSWDDLVRHEEDIWDGIRNYQARNYLKSMQLGDQVLFYHSGKDKAIVGIAEVSDEAFPDPKDEDGKGWVAVRIKAIRPLKNQISLDRMKKEDALSTMLLFKQSRLSVMPVEKPAYELIVKLGA